MFNGTGAILETLKENGWQFYSELDPHKKRLVLFGYHPSEFAVGSRAEVPSAAPNPFELAAETFLEGIPPELRRKYELLKKKF